MVNYVVCSDIFNASSLPMRAHNALPNLSFSVIFSYRRWLHVYYFSARHYSPYSSIKGINQISNINIGKFSSVFQVIADGRICYFQAR